MRIQDIKNIYFLGIGGIGMSALARYFNASGKMVAGYDRTSTPLTDELIDEGIQVHFSDSVKLIPEFIKSGNKHQTLVIYTPAIPKDQLELAYFQEKEFELKKRSEVLGMLTKDKFTIAVAGTHGKTTTSSMIAHLLKSAGLNCSAFLGGISKNYQSNLLLAKNPGQNEIVVVEADEYDRSFLTLFPDVAVITSMDADHLDIYGDKKYLEDSYRLFAKQVKPNGKLVFKKGLPLDTTESGRSMYAIDEQADYSADDIRILDHHYHFNWHNHSSTITGITSGMPGRHNVENSVAAIAVARMMNIPDDAIRKAFASYQGVRRRFDYRVRSKEIVYIDDYAHHPEELRACIASVKELYPGKKITGVFQPHLFSRTRDFAEGFGKSLSMLDRLLLLDIYPARELPIPGVDSKMILDLVTIKDKKICSKAEVLDELSKNKPEVLLTLGAGDIDQLVEPIAKLYK